MGENHLEKSTLRGLMREKRRQLSAAQRQAAAQSLPQIFMQLPGWNTVQRIALYMGSDCEIDPKHLAEQSFEQGKSLYLPVIENDQSLSFRAWEPAAKLEINRFGIAQPLAEAVPAAPDELDIICLPLVGWDRKGGRIGMGGGFYDRTLAGIEHPLRVGLGYECQATGSVPMESWDVRLHYVATESTLHNCQDAEVGEAH